MNENPIDKEELRKLHAAAPSEIQTELIDPGPGPVASCHETSPACSEFYEAAHQAVPGLIEQLAIATDAIDYALNRVGTDAEFAYHMLFTETLDRLVRAYARIEGRDPKAVRDEILERTSDLPKSRCEADREFIDGGGHV